MNRPRIININLRNWDKWARLIVYHQHKLFSKQMWWSRREFKDLLANGHCIARVMVAGSEFLGFVLGARDRPEELQSILPGCRIIHIFSFFIVKNYQGRGYGRGLLADFLKESKKRGYHKITGNVRPGPQLTNRKSFGARELLVKKNFKGTGEDYIFCVTDLQ